MNETSLLIVFSITHRLLGLSQTIIVFTAFIVIAIEMEFEAH
jgi:hypothetical protein